MNPYLFFGTMLFGLVLIFLKPIVDLFWKYFGDSILAEDHIPGDFILVDYEGLLYVVPMPASHTQEVQED